MTTGPRTVYVIDDDASVVRAFARLIRAAGMKAVELSGVRELAKIEALDPEGTVVTDIRMPGESGLTVPATLAKRGILEARASGSSESEWLEAVPSKHPPSGSTGAKHRSKGCR